MGAFVSGSDYLKGQRARALIRDEVNAALVSADVLVCADHPAGGAPPWARARSR